jgi:hypothetical protein
MLGNISVLDLATGIKDMLVSNGFTSLDAITKMPPAELALILGIDFYVARLIYLSAKRHREIERLQRQINDQEMNEALSGSNRTIKLLWIQLSNRLQGK